MTSLEDGSVQAVQEKVPQKDEYNIWETFLHVDDSRVSDAAPVLDDAWLAARGVESISPIVFRHLRDEVLPLVRRLEHEEGLVWFFFLIHDRASGVPTTPDDKGLYIHMRMEFVRRGPDFDLSMLLPPEWSMTRRAELPGEIAGVDAMAFNGDVGRAWRLMGEQSAWLVRLVEAHAEIYDSGKPIDELTYVRHAKQFLHFLANMCQMRVS
jgi:hypothetical protein